MYIPNIGGIHDSDVVSQQGLCESRDCRSHERLSMGETDSCIRFHSDHDECRNVIVGFPLAYEDTQDSKSYLHGIGNVISDSKYLEATQSLLHDAVNVKKALKQQFKHESLNKCRKVLMESDSIPVTPSGKQDLQNKITKLSSMLNEVDRRYKQYYHEIQIVVSSFDALAGHGASIPYTALTLQTVSRQFRFLKDAIKRQIQVMSTRLGKTDSDGEGIRIPRLRFVDQKVSVSRVQQLGRMWRPQRGFPERSVSILRAWLFEHFLHPYPKDSDKNMLARQTGLTRSQVANWFINARVRLWKPMVEEMYKQESIIL
ncbi:hypothetical protein LXL04_001743 [Taraxacum kok-saghyz]